MQPNEDGGCGHLGTTAFLGLLLVQLLPAGEVSAQHTSPAVDQILERYIEAVGGRDAVAKLRTRVMTGRLVTDLPSRSPPVYEEVSIEIRAASANGYLVTEQSAGGTRWDGFDGAIQWSQDGVRVTLHDRVDVRFAWLVDPQNALRMREYFPDLRLRGSRRLEDRLVYVVDMDNDESHALCFDAASGLLVRLGYNRELGEYRTVDGVQVPFRVALSRKGGSSTYVFDRIEHDVPVDASLFAVPDTSGVDHSAS
jgi:hypothetical protein